MATLPLKRPGLNTDILASERHGKSNRQILYCVLNPSEQTYKGIVLCVYSFNFIYNRILIGNANYTYDETLSKGANPY
jgi:hypothetical protein